jgi:hypothetical protein
LCTAPDSSSSSTSSPAPPTSLSLLLLLAMVLSLVTLLLLLLLILDDPLLPVEAELQLKKFVIFFTEGNLFNNFFIDFCDFLIL